MTMHTEHAEEIERGRELVEADAQPLDQLDQLAMCAYFSMQRERVRRLGCCGKNETWISPMGTVLCKHTRDPCPREKLAEIIAQWALINRRDNATRTSRFARRRYRAGRKP